MGQAWAALLGALVGGLLTLLGSFAVELRRDRRRQIGAARLVLAELDRARLEFLVHELDEEGWIEGPHPEISSATWQANAAEFVGTLGQRPFQLVDRAAKTVRQAGEWGFTHRSIETNIEELARAQEILEPLSRPTRWDRHVWRL